LDALRGSSGFIVGAYILQLTAHPDMTAS